LIFNFSGKLFVLQLFPIGVRGFIRSLVCFPKRTRTIFHVVRFFRQTYVLGANLTGGITGQIGRLLLGLTGQADRLLLGMMWSSRPLVVRSQGFAYCYLARVNEFLDALGMKRVGIGGTIGATEVLLALDVGNEPRLRQLSKSPAYRTLAHSGHLHKPELAWIDYLTALEGNQLTKHSDLARASPYVSQIRELDCH
jgi:hypothetical protein